MILSELIQRAISISNGVADTTQLADLAEIAAEPLLIQVFRDVAMQLASSSSTRSLLRRTKTVAFVSGVVTLTSDVLTDYLCESTLVDPTDRTKRYSLTTWNQFVSDELDARLGHFAVEGETTMRVIEPNTTYSPTTGPTVSLELTTPCVPAVPATPGAAVLATDEVVARLIHALAGALTAAKP